MSFPVRSRSRYASTATPPGSSSASALEPLMSLIHRPPPFSPSPADIDEVLLRRADRIRRKRGDREEEHDTAGASLLWLAQIRVAGETYALPLPHVRAAMPLRMVSPVPLAPPWVLGILRFRGEPVVAMSLVSLLGVRGWRVDPAVLIVVETSGGGREADGDPRRVSQARRRIALDCEEVPLAAPVSREVVEEARAA